jgi:hypothetical protein
MTVDCYPYIVFRTDEPLSPRRPSMKPFFLLLLLIVSGMLLEILFRPFGCVQVLYQRLHRAPARLMEMRRNRLPAAGLFGSFRHPRADEAWNPARQF